MQISNESVGDLSFIFIIISIIIIYFKILAILTLMLDLDLHHTFIEHNGSNANSTIV